MCCFSEDDEGKYALLVAHTNVSKLELCVLLLSTLVLILSCRNVRNINKYVMNGTMDT